MNNRSPAQTLQPVSEITPRKIVKGFALPDRSLPSENEFAWIVMLRAIVGDQVPPPTLRAVQALRQAMMGG